MTDWQHADQTELDIDLGELAVELFSVKEESFEKLVDTYRLALRLN